MNKRLLIMLPGLVLAGTGCVRMTHQLEQSKPLEINVNVRLQVDRELEEFFAFERKYHNGAATQPAQPAPAPAEVPPPVAPPAAPETPPQPAPAQEPAGGA